MANPPITVGELNDVPAPLSPVNAQFHQEVANRIIHRFVTEAALIAWAAANGSMAYVTSNNTHYARRAGSWWPLTYQANLDQANANLINAINNVQANLNNTNANLATYPQGMLSVAYAGFAELNTSSQVVCSVTWSADPSRWYRLIGDIVRINSGAINQDVVFVIEDNAGNDYRLTMFRFGADPPQQFAPLHLELVINGLSGPQTWRLAGNTSTGVAQIPAGLRNASNAMLTVEDMGVV